jgi:peptidoglycan/LPS O-acetylase OafA/YrhL
MLPMAGSTPPPAAKVEPMRYEALDCLRGIAACTVVICHALMAGLFRVEPQWSTLKWTPLRLLWSGHQAVILFFVLSGFSLYILYSALSASANRVPKFLAARWLRLYPVYAASLLFASASYWLLARLGYAWPDSTLYVPAPAIPAKQFLMHYTLIGNFNTSLINPPAWSIVHEMRISILFPLIAWVIERSHYRIAIAGLLTSVAIATSCWDAPQTYGSSSIVMDALTTLHYSTFFIIGALLARHRNTLIARVRTLPRSLTPIVFATALALYGYGYDDTWTSGQIMLGDLIVGIGAAAIVLLAISYRVLERSRILHFLGRISYSLYLVHFTCFGVVCVLLYGKLPNPVLWLTIGALSVAIASVTCRAIEKPSLRWSRRVRTAQQSVVSTPSSCSPDDIKPTA